MKLPPLPAAAPRFSAPLAAFLVCTALASAQPTDNPVKTFYSGPEGYPVWTDSIKWDNVVNMATYAVPGEPAADNFRKFEHARDALHAAGGGVLYYPAGTYEFVLPSHDPNGGRGLMLKSGVVIRGEAPTGDKFARPTATYPEDGVLALGTKFVFEKVFHPGRVAAADQGGFVPKSSWNIVGAMPGTGEVGLRDVHDIGLVWVQLEYASIFVGFDAQWAENWSVATYLGGRTRHDAPYPAGDNRNWFKRVADGTHPGDPFAGALNPGGLPYGRTSQFLGAPRGILVMGCAVVNGAVVNDFYYPSGDRARNGGPIPHPYRFIGRVSVHGSDVFLGNNTLPQPTANFVRTEYVNSNSATPTDSGNAANKGFALSGYTVAEVGGAKVGQIILNGHGLTNGQWIGVGGAAEFQLIGFKGPVTVVDDNTFTFPLPADAPLTPTASGTARIWIPFAHPLLYDHANTIGFDVNKSLYGLAKPTEPDLGYYAHNVVVRDNFAFNRGNKGFEISGSFVTIHNNYNKRFFLGFDLPAGYTPYGGTRTGNSLEGWAYQGSGVNSNDYLSRGFDLGGRNLWVDLCGLDNSGSTGNDAESILIQRHNNVETYSWAYTDNWRINVSYGPNTVGFKGGYIGGYDVHNFGALWVRNNSNTTAAVGHLKGTQSSDGTPKATDRGNLLLDAALLNNTGSPSMATGWDGRNFPEVPGLDATPFGPHRNGTDGTPFGPGFAVGAFDAIGDGHDGTKGAGGGHPSQAPVHTDAVSAPANVAAARREDGSVLITYEDTADNEFGFRIQRRMGTGPWHTVAYRPRQSLLKLYRPDPTIPGDIGVGFPIDLQGRSLAKNDGLSPDSFRKDPWSDLPVWDLNPELWVVYTAPKEVDLEYRVIALNGADVRDDAVEPAASMGRDSALLAGGGTGGNPFAAWIGGFGGVPQDKRGATDNPSGDGVANLVKYALAGFDPAASQADDLPSPVTAGADLKVTFPKNPASAGAVAYGIEAWIDGAWVDAATQTGFTVTQDAAEISVTLPNGAQGVLIRLKVTLN